MFTGPGSVAALVADVRSPVVVAPLRRDPRCERAAQTPVIVSRGRTYDRPDGACAQCMDPQKCLGFRKMLHGVRAQNEHTDRGVERRTRGGVDQRMSRTSVLSIAILVYSAAPATLALPQSTSAPLQLSLSCGRTPELAFRLTIQNVSSTPAAAVIGLILANDKKYLLSPASLIVTRPGESDITLPYMDVTVVAIVGRADPWLVMLPAGASYSVSVPAQDFRSSPDLNDFTRPAKVQVRLTTEEIGHTNSDMQGLKFVHVWVGTLVSQWLEVPRECPR